MPVRVDDEAFSSRTLMAQPPGHLILQLMTGATSAFTCRKWPIASYYLYVPTCHPLSRQLRQAEPNNRDRNHPVVVVVHGSGRDAEGERDQYKDFAEEHGCVVVCPLFPCDTMSLDGVDNYKRLVYQGYGMKTPLRFDQILLDMLDEISDTWGYVEVSRFVLTGFSGGGQFVHRFFYLHPERLLGVCVGAPGNATYLDPTQPWPLGIMDVSDRLGGAAIDFDKLRRIPVRLFVGSADTYHPVSADGTPVALSRLGVIERLSDDFTRHNIDHEFRVQDGVAHEGYKLLHLIMPFVSKCLRGANEILGD